MPYSFTMKRGVLLLLLYYTGLLPFVPLGESLLQFYVPRIINRWRLKAELWLWATFNINWRSIWEECVRKMCVCGFFLFAKDLHPWEAHPEEQANCQFAWKVGKLPGDELFLTTFRNPASRAAVFMDKQNHTFTVLCFYSRVTMRKSLFEHLAARGIQVWNLEWESGQMPKAIGFALQVRLQ